jgi:hydroxyethylthiazole kinase-like uncharacterized protein yjeF
MVRGRIGSKLKTQNLKFSEIVNLTNEEEITYQLTKYLIKNFPYKKFVFDAGALQMMDKDWLLDLKTGPILTPHQKEFRMLFGVDLVPLSFEEKKQQVETVAKQYHCTVLLKSVSDIISNGEETYVIEGGNAGLTKGGTGDVLASLITSFYAKNSSLASGIIASFLLKKSADELFNTKGYWYNIADIINKLPEVLRRVVIDKD